MRRCAARAASGIAVRKLMRKDAITTRRFFFFSYAECPGGATLITDEQEAADGLHSCTCIHARFIDSARAKLYRVLFCLF